MHRRWWAPGTLIVITLLVVGLAPAAAAQPGPRALVKISWQQPAGPGTVASSGVPVYARLAGREGAYLLAGAVPWEQEMLQAQGLQATVLDPDLRGASYYLAYLQPNRPPPEWTVYGRLLLDDGQQFLLRATPRDAERLAGLGVEITALTLEPIRLDPRTEGRIPDAVQPDPTVAAIVDQVDQATLYQYEEWLTGVETATIGGEPYTIATRHTDSGTPIQKATQFAYEHLEALGLGIEYQDWSSGGHSGRNVIGELTGLTDPGDIWIIGAHLDDMPAGLVAPGADDNASGAVATLVAADILSQYEWGCTLRFALWTGEEQGLLGSRAYATRSANLGENIAGYLNLDMIAWNTAGSSPGIDLIYSPTMPSSQQLAQLFADVIDAYDLNLVPELRISLAGGSDHVSFWQQGYTSILAIEDQDDFDPYYHTTADALSNLQDMPYYSQFVKAAVGTFVHLSGCLIPSASGYLEGQVTAGNGGAPIANATITMAGQGGDSFQTVTGEGGYYTQTLPAGTYTVTAEAAAYRPATATGVVVMAGEVTTQNLVLGPLPCILLVDDDDNVPDARPTYTAALGALGYENDLFDAGSGNGPTLTGLEGYAIVIWFTGAKHDGTAGPNSADEANLAAYLAGGGRLFLSSQDYLHDMGLTSFGQAYLGIDAYTDDAGDAGSFYGVSGDPIGQDLGPYLLAYPDGFGDRGDSLDAATGASVAFRSSSTGGNPLAVDRDGGYWRTAFFGTSWVPVYHGSAANGEEVLQRTIDWFGACQCEAVQILTTTAEVSGCEATLGADLVGTAPFAYQWDLGFFGSSTAPTVTVDFGSSGTYPYTLTVANCGGVASDTITNTATVACTEPRWYTYLPVILREE